MSKKRTDKKSRQVRKITIQTTNKISFPETPYGEIRKTRKHCGEEISNLWESIASFYILLHYLEFNVVANVFRNLKKRADWEPMVTVISHNEVIRPTLFLCIRELNTFLYELQIASYNGAARTLRCIIETALEASDFQTQEHRPKFSELIDHYYELDEKQSSGKNNGLESVMLQHNAWVAFKERYKIHEQTKRIAPSFRELVNRLNSREFFIEAPEVNNALKEIYERLSDFVHPSSERIERQMEINPSPIPRFKKEQLTVMYELSIQILDIVQFLYIKSMSHFLNYNSCKELLRDLSESAVESKEIAPLFFKLPIVSDMLKQIQL
jgi:hypothetical protein